MTEVVQRFLLRNTVWLQKLVNERLAKKTGAIGKFAKWMEIGPRTNGHHYIPRYFRLWNQYILTFGFRFTYSRPHMLKYLANKAPHEGARSVPHRLRRNISFLVLVGQKEQDKATIPLQRSASRLRQSLQYEFQVRSLRAFQLHELPPVRPLP